VNRPRGQNLIMFALTLLLLTLMVLVTLQIGLRTRERIEAQMVADAAAYSEAVTTARTYNMVAVMNRASVAHYTSLLGTESLISWAGLMRGSAASVSAALQSCGANGLALELRNSALAANAAWEQADDDAGEQARQQQGHAQRLKAATRTFYTDQFIGGQLAEQKLAARIARLANPELAAPAIAAQKSLDEVDPGCAAGAACLSGDGRAFTSAVMGSRGWVFTTDRSNVVGTGGVALLASVLNTGGGGSGFGDDPWFGTVEPGEPAERSGIFEFMTGEGAWAHDHGGSVTVRVGGCVATATVSSSFVMSSALEVLTDKHAYTGIDVGRPEPVRHTLLSCPPAVPGCPAVIGGMLTFNRALLPDWDNDSGQPKLYAVIERDFRARTRREPWNLLFNFQFMRSGAGAMFDNGSPNGSFLTPAGADLSRQVAVGAGLAYYHRPLGAGGGYLEPPNFLNPFWRASLAPPDKDVGARLDAAGYPEMAAAYAALKRRGFKGVP
jgi:hypothetical protein